jgi:hypothetical protein
LKKSSTLVIVALLTSLPILAQSDFSGKWDLNTEKSKNIGMMAQMKLVATIRQTASELVVSNATTFNGQEGTSEIRLDLTGKPLTNKNPMEAPAATVSKWQGSKLVTTWTSPGSVAGSTSVRTETRSLSADAHTLTVESRRGSSPALVMVYDRE